MNQMIKKAIAIIIYFFTPEDTSQTNYGHLSIAFKPDSDDLGFRGLGSAKALFWIVNGILIFYLLSRI